MNKKVWIAGMMAAAMLLGAGCGQKPGTAEQEQNQNQDQNQTQEQNQNQNQPSVSQPAEQGNATNASGGAAAGETVSESEETKTEQIVVYYTDPDMMNLVSGKTDISYQSEDEKYEAAFKAMQTSREELVSLWEKAGLNTAVFADGKLTLDIHLPNEANLGAGGEAFALDALKNTFFQFGEVEFIQILIDGQQVDSLMGHVALENPESR